MRRGGLTVTFPVPAAAVGVQDAHGREAVGAGGHGRGLALHLHELHRRAMLADGLGAVTQPPRLVLLQVGRGTASTGANTDSGPHGAEGLCLPPGRLEAKGARPEGAPSASARLTWGRLRTQGQGHLEWPAERQHLGLQMPGRCVRCQGAKTTHRPLTCLGGSKSGHAGGLVVADVLGAVDGRVVGVDALGVAEGVGVEGVSVGEGEDGQDQL